jgi:Na+/glutamate symporter
MYNDYTSAGLIAGAVAACALVVAVVGGVLARKYLVRRRNVAGEDSGESTANLTAAQ